MVDPLLFVDTEYAMMALLPMPSFEFGTCEVDYNIVDESVTVIRLHFPRIEPIVLKGKLKWEIPPDGPTV